MSHKVDVLFIMLSIKNLYCEGKLGYLFDFEGKTIISVVTKIFAERPHDVSLISKLLNDENR